MIAEAIAGTAVKLEPLPTIEARAAALIDFCDGLEEAGFGSLARRSRAVARSTLELAHAFATERTARQKIQADRDRCVDLLADHAGQGLRGAA